MISSPHNARVKHVRRLIAERRYRERQGSFVIEGSRWLNEVIAAGLSPTLLLATAAWLADLTNEPTIAQLAVPVLEIDEKLLNELADTETPPGILGVVPMINRPLPSQPTLLLILDAVRTPGNLGAMLRTAAAAGVDGVLLAPGCVDPYNPKVVRAGMGAQLRIPLLQAKWPEISHICRQMVVWLAESSGGAAYTTISWQVPCALIIGNEARGPGHQANQLATGTVYIPMAPGAESLNAAVAAGILLFEARRQRSAPEFGRNLDPQQG